MSTVTEGPAAPENCFNSYLWILFIFCQLGILSLNLFIFFLESRRLERAKQKLDQNRGALYKYIWIHKVFLATFAANSIYCAGTVLCTLVRVIWPGRDHLGFFAILEDTFLELQCGVVLLVASLESAALVKLSRLSDCYPNILRFNKRWVVFTSVATVAIFGSLFSLQLTALSTSPSHSEHWNSVDQPLMSTKIMALSGLAFCVLIINCVVLLWAPKFHTARQEVISRIAVENLDNDDVSHCQINMLYIVDTQKHQQSPGLKPVQEEGNPLLQNQVSYDSCIPNGNAVLKMRQDAEEDVEIDGNIQAPQPEENSEEICGSEEVKRRQNTQNKPRPESTFSLTGVRTPVNRFSLRTESAFQNINNILRVKSVLSLSNSIREGVLPQGIVSSTTLKYIPISCFVYSKSWFTAWQVARLPLVNSLVCTLIIIHGFVHLTGVLETNDSWGLTEPYCGRNNWLFYLVQIFFNFIFLGIKPLFYLGLYRATQDLQTRPPPTGACIM